MIPTMWHEHPSLRAARCYEPVWAACAEAGPGGAHPLGRGRLARVQRQPRPVRAGGAVLDPPAAVAAAALGRVRPPSRPAVRGGRVRARGGWATCCGRPTPPSAPTRKVKKLNSRTKGLIQRLPSEYVGTNVFIGASTMSREEIRRRHRNGIDALMWGTDYPHPEGSWPHTAERLGTDFQQVSIEDTRLLLGLNAVRCYDLDAGRPDRHRRAASGPRPSDLHQDPDAAHRARRDPRGPLVVRRLRHGVEGMSRRRRRRRRRSSRTARSPWSPVAPAGSAGRSPRRCCGAVPPVVIADIEAAGARRRPSPSCSALGPVHGVRTDVSDEASVAALADHVWSPPRPLRPALPQRRGHLGRRRPAVAAGAERLALVLRRQRVRRRDRRQRVRAPHARRRPPRPGRGHLVGRRRLRPGGDGVGLRRVEGGGQLLHRGAPAQPGPAGHGAAGVGLLPVGWAAWTRACTPPRATVPSTCSARARAPAARA